MSPYVVALTPDEQAYCDDVADYRHAGKRGSDGVHMNRNQPSIVRHRIGVRGEFLVARELLGRIDERVFGRKGDGGGRDFQLLDGLWVEVKTRTKRGWDFALRGSSVSELIASVGVLVWPAEDGRFDTFQVMGYITRERFARVATRRSYVAGNADDVTRLAVSVRDLYPFENIVKMYRHSHEPAVPLAELARKREEQQHVSTDNRIKPEAHFKPGDSDTPLVGEDGTLRCGCGYMLADDRCRPCGVNYCRECRKPTSIFRSVCVSCSLRQQIAIVEREVGDGVYLSQSERVRLEEEERAVTAVLSGSTEPNSRGVEQQARKAASVRRHHKRKPNQQSFEGLSLNQQIT